MRSAQSCYRSCYKSFFVDLSATLMATSERGLLAVAARLARCWPADDRCSNCFYELDYNIPIFSQWNDGGPFSEMFLLLRSWHA